MDSRFSLAHPPRLEALSQTLQQPPVPPPLQGHLVMPTPEAGWTLDEWWQRRVLPDLKARNRRQSTLANYATYLRRWREWSNLRIIHPKVCEINPGTLSEFMTYLKTVCALDDPLIDKHLRAISALLRKAQEDWVITRAARLPSLAAKQSGLKFTFSLEETGALYLAAAGCQWPARFADGKPVSDELRALYWRAYLVGAWNYGFRVEEWWRYTGSGNSPEPLCWSGVSFAGEAVIEGRAIANAEGWLSWVQQKTGHALALPMNAVVRARFEELARAIPAARRAAPQRVFAFPHSAGTAKAKQKITPASGFYAAWWDLCQRAGITPLKSSDGSNATHCPNQYRKTARTLHGDQVGTAAADWITGHVSGKGVGERCYYNAVGQVIKSLHAIPQPPEFLS